MRRSLILFGIFCAGYLLPFVAYAILMTAPVTGPHRQAPGGWVMDEDSNEVDSVTGLNTMPAPEPTSDPDPDPDPDPNTDQIGVILTWSHANERIDGAPMNVGQIARYEIDYAGSVIAVGVVTRHEMDMPIPPPWMFRIRTVDTDGQTGPWSAVVTVPAQ